MMTCNNSDSKGFTARMRGLIDHVLNICCIIQILLFFSIIKLQQEYRKAINSLLFETI